MISAALELCMKDGQVSHRWYMCAASHGYGGLDGAGMVVVNGMHAGHSQGVWSRVGRCRSISRVRGDTLMTPDHTDVQMRCGRVKSEIIGLPQNALTRDTTKRLQFVVHAASWLHVMVLHGHTAVVGKQGHAPCKILLLQQSLFSVSMKFYVGVMIM